VPDWQPDTAADAPAQPAWPWAGGVAWRDDSHGAPRLPAWPAAASADHSAHIAVVANDPLVRGGSTWGLYGDRSPVPSVAGSQAAEAWDSGITGRSSSVVGVVDTGIDYTHPDLYLNIWLNQGELPAGLALVDVDMDGLIGFRDLNAAANAGTVADLNRNGRIDAGDLLADKRWSNGIDEDRNGRPDDLVGWDFANGDNNPFDDNGHGTHVAGIIGAIGGNGLGVAGVNWAVQLMPLKFLNAGGAGTANGAAQAVSYFTQASLRAAARGDAADYVATNHSWGDATYLKALDDAIAAAARADILTVVAAGNNSRSNDSRSIYPANYSTVAAAGYEAVVSVAALTATGGLASYSNWGSRTVDLAAPGSDIQSTLPGTGYGALSGTSMAAPFVSGALALLASVAPETTGAQRVQALLASSTATPALAGRAASGGRLDVATLVQADNASAGGPATRALVTGAQDDTQPLAGPLANGGQTNDHTPLLTGSLSQALAAGEVLAVYRGGVRLLPQVSGTSWQLADNLGPDGAYAYTAQVERGGSHGPTSAPWQLTLDTTAPLATAPVTGLAQDSPVLASLANGATTSDHSPTVSGLVQGTLGAGESVVVYRNGSAAGSASRSGQAWTFTDAGLPDGAASYTARVEDAAGNGGAWSSARSLVVGPPAATTITGTAGNDILRGDALANQLSGVPASDSTLGRGAFDQLTGGAGADTFVLGDRRGAFYDDGNSRNAGLTDLAWITDFQSGQDKLQLAQGSYLFRDATARGLSGLGVFIDSNGDGVWDSRDELIGLLNRIGALQPGDLAYVAPG
jgi:subtilisin family serine protease